MASTSDDGEKTCPLCAEEMDLTDQQLKPCKCGYEICVWCWHHIMEMAEKEDSEGRCPACRSPYNKEKIVGMATNCERVVAELNAERKQKTQRAKPKASMEARKHFNGVRVIKRNLVYIIGLPTNLADESILERKEYFGQYGKVLKTSISRTANTTATAQQVAHNNTFSVYITYAREEEAICCIQAVHNFVLEGKPLRACFGTTKYCHIWLRNMTCTNPDCLYLHDGGSQEDSFTKDEIISAYTRSKVPQSASNNLQRRSGHFLPPPVDDLCNNGAVSGKHVLKSASSNTSGLIKVSTNISTCGKSIVLPAAASWGSRVSNCRPPAASMASSQIPAKQKVDMLNSSSCLSSVVASTKQTSAWHDDAVTSSKIPEGRQAAHTNHRSRPLEPIKPDIGKDSQTTVSDVSSETVVDAARASNISAWDDDFTTLKIPGGIHMRVSSRTGETLRPGIGRDCETSVDVSMDNVMVDACRSAWDDEEVTTSQIPEGRHIIHRDGSSRAPGTTKPAIDRDCQTYMSDMSLKPVIGASHTSRISISCSSSPLAPVTEDKDGGINVLGDNTNFVNSICPDVSDRRSSSSVPDEVSNGLMVNGKIENLCAGLASVNLDSHLGIDHPSMDQHQSSISNHCSTSMHRNLASRLQQYYPENGVECLASTSLSKTSVNSDARVSRGLSDRNSDLEVHVLASSGNVTGDSLLAADDKKDRHSHAINQPSCLANEHHPLNILNRSSNSFWNNDAANSCVSDNVDSRTVHTEVDRTLSLFRENGPALCNEQKEDKLSGSYTKEKAKYLGRLDDVSNIGKTASVDMGESKIISDILSLDFDPWDDSLSSANNFAKLLGETDKQDGSSKLSSSWKLQHSNQSKFSFARQDNQSNVLDTSVKNTGDTRKLCSSSEDVYGDGFEHGSQIDSFDGSIDLLNSNSSASSDTTAIVARGKILPPPGFPVPNRAAPPPGFSSHDRYGLSYETFSENRLLGHSSLRNQYQVHSSGNTSDVEFIDPAILAVGKGVLPLGVTNSGLGSRYAFPSQFSNSDSDTRFHLLKQQFISTHQDPRISEHIGDRFLPLNDAYISSRLVAQNHRQSPLAQISQQHRTSHLLGNHWDGWNDKMIGNELHVAEILRNERLGLNSYFPVSEEHKFHRASSGDLYNRAFGM